MNNAPFQITEKILTLTSEISELAGRISSTEGLSTNPILRKTNRIKSIYSSLAIEQNTLTLDQVTAVLEGKLVLAPPKDIKEVQNAYEIYEILDSLDPYSEEDLLLAHGVMTKELVKESGMYRTGPVGVVNKEGKVVHFGTLPAYVQDLTSALLQWTKTSDLPMPVKSCVFHYEFEVIHPFADGNGRVGRLWHTLLLSKWNPLFAWLPIESIIHNHQDDYYRAINVSNSKVDSTAFIEFMLSVIKEALSEATSNSSKSRTELVLDLFKDKEFIQNKDVCDLLKVSTATANRILASMIKDGTLNKTHIGRYWTYELNEKL